MSGERIVVVGAGMAGLAAAFRLQEAGFDVRVLEAADHVGGRMWTIEHEGYRIDTGAVALSSRYKRLIQLAHDAGLSDEMQPSTDVIGFLRDGQVHRLRTTHRVDGLRTGLLSARGKAGMANAVIDVLRYWRSARHAGHDVPGPHRRGGDEPRHARRELPRRQPRRVVPPPGALCSDARASPGAVGG